MNEKPKVKFASWPADLLIDYVRKIHHRGIRKEGPELIALLDQVTSKWCTQYPELVQLTTLFTDSVNALDIHCSKEEKVLFPYLYELYEANHNKRKKETLQNGSVIFLINVMINEHAEESEWWDIIIKTTNNFTPPIDTDDDFRQMMASLKRFYDLYLLEHIHLENDILFPWALRAEQELKAAKT